MSTAYDKGFRAGMDKAAFKLPGNLVNSFKGWRPGWKGIAGGAVGIGVPAALSMLPMLAGGASQAEGGYAPGGGGGYVPGGGGGYVPGVPVALPSRYEQPYLPVTDPDKSDEKSLAQKWSPFEGIGMDVE